MTGGMRGTRIAIPAQIIVESLAENKNLAETLMFPNDTSSIFRAFTDNWEVKDCSFTEPDPPNSEPAKIVLELLPRTNTFEKK